MDDKILPVPVRSTIQGTPDNMYYVYLLKSKNKGLLYTGFTKNINRRFLQHKTKQVLSTKGMSDLELVYFEAFKNKHDAIRREKYLKTTKGKRAVKLMLKYSLS